MDSLENAKNGVTDFVSQHPGWIIGAMVVLALIAIYMYWRPCADGKKAGKKSGSAAAGDDDEEFDELIAAIRKAQEKKRGS